MLHEGTNGAVIDVTDDILGTRFRSAKGTNTEIIVWNALVGVVCKNTKRFSSFGEASKWFDDHHFNKANRNILNLTVDLGSYVSGSREYHVSIYSRVHMVPLARFTGAQTCSMNFAGSHVRSA